MARSDYEKPLGRAMASGPDVVFVELNGPDVDPTQISCSAAVTGSGTPLCQPAFRSGVLGWLMAGPGSGLSEEPVWGCEPVALESESSPRCPPGPVIAWAIASLSIAWKTMSESRRFTHRIASMGPLPSSRLRS